jgi:murein DD-endopeptidase MepM/ murein hydrolase activator NlpD
VEERDEGVARALMPHVLGTRAGLSLARPVLWICGGLAALFLAGASTIPVPASARGSALPVAGATITQRFGCTTVLFEPVDFNCASGHVHTGVDLAAPAGTPVYSVCAGSAVPFHDAGGYGTHVVVDCGLAIQMLYGHLTATAITGSVPVSAGALLGWVGSTGMSTGPHLHFEVRRSGVAVDPMAWLPAYAGTPDRRRDQRW